MPNQAKIMKGSIVLGTAFVALLLRSSPVIADVFFISALHSGKCMQVDGASRDDGATISQWDCVNQANVYWRFRGGPPDFSILKQTTVVNALPSLRWIMAFMFIRIMAPLFSKMIVITLHQIQTGTYSYGDSKM